MNLGLKKQYKQGIKRQKKYDIAINWLCFTMTLNSPLTETCYFER